MDDIKRPQKENRNKQSEINLRQPASNQDKSIVQWQAPAFEYYPKDVSWYWLSFIIAILLVAFSIWQKNFLFAVFIFLAEISVLMMAGRKPDLIKFEINEKGLSFLEKNYSFNDLEKFCLRPSNEDKNFEELILKKKTHINPYLKIFVDARVSSQVSDILSQKLNEEQYEESLLDSILKWLRF